jgi:hypothetical protein
MEAELEEIEQIQRNDPENTDYLLSLADIPDHQSRNEVIDAFASAARRSTHLKDLRLVTANLTVQAMETVASTINESSISKLILYLQFREGMASPDLLLSNFVETLNPEKLTTFHVCLHESPFILEENINVTSFLSRATALERFGCFFMEIPRPSMMTGLLVSMWKGLGRNTSAPALQLDVETLEYVCTCERVYKEFCQMLECNEDITTLVVIGLDNYKEVSSETGYKLAHALKDRRELTVYIVKSDLLALSFCRQLGRLSGLVGLVLRDISSLALISEAFANGVARSPSLIAFRISYSRHASHSCIGYFLERLAPVIKCNTKLKALSIKGTAGEGSDDRISSTIEDLGYSCRGFTSFANALVENTHLRMLELCRIGLDDECAETFGSALPRMKGLRNICFGDNDFSGAGLVAIIVSGLEGNYNIIEFDGGDVCKEDPALSHRITFYLWRNHLNFGHFLHSDTPLSFWPHMLERLHTLSSKANDSGDADYIFSFKYHLLRERIDLLVGRLGRDTRKGKRAAEHE